MDNKASTQEQIIKVATDLFSKRGYFGVSMADIAKELKITKAALYYHFKSKEEIYLSVVESVFKKLPEQIKEGFNIAKSPPDILLKMIQAYLKGVI